MAAELPRQGIRATTLAAAALLAALAGALCGLAVSVRRAYDVKTRVRRVHAVAPRGADTATVFFDVDLEHPPSTSHRVTFHRARCLLRSGGVHASAEVPEIRYLPSSVPAQQSSSLSFPVLVRAGPSAAKALEPRCEIDSTVDLFGTGLAIPRTVRQPLAGVSGAAPKVWFERAGELRRPPLRSALQNKTITLEQGATLNAHLSKGALSEFLHEVLGSAHISLDTSFSYSESDDQSMQLTKTVNASLDVRSDGRGGYEVSLPFNVSGEVRPAKIGRTLAKVLFGRERPYKEAPAAEYGDVDRALRIVADEPQSPLVQYLGTSRVVGWRSHKDSQLNEMVRGIGGHLGRRLIGVAEDAYGRRLVASDTYKIQMQESLYFEDTVIDATVNAVMSEKNMEIVFGFDSTDEGGEQNALTLNVKANDIPDVGEEGGTVSLTAAWNRNDFVYLMFEKNPLKLTLVAKNPDNGMKIVEATGTGTRSGSVTDTSMSVRVFEAIEDVLGGGCEERRLHAPASVFGRRPLRRLSGSGDCRRLASAAQNELALQIDVAMSDRYGGAFVLDASVKEPRGSAMETLAEVDVDGTHSDMTFTLTHAIFKTSDDGGVLSEVLKLQPAMLMYKEDNYAFSATVYLEGSDTEFVTVGVDTTNSGATVELDAFSSTITVDFKDDLGEDVAEVPCLQGRCEIAASLKNEALSIAAKSWGRDSTGNAVVDHWDIAVAGAMSDSEVVMSGDIKQLNQAGVLARLIFVDVGLRNSNKDIALDEWTAKVDLTLNDIDASDALLIVDADASCRPSPFALQGSLDVEDKETTLLSISGSITDDNSGRIAGSLVGSAVEDHWTCRKCWYGDGKCCDEPQPVDGVSCSGRWFKDDGDEDCYGGEKNEWQETNNFKATLRLEELSDTASAYVGFTDNPSGTVDFLSLEGEIRRFQLDDFEANVTVEVRDAGDLDRKEGNFSAVARSASGAFSMDVHVGAPEDEKDHSSKFQVHHAVSMTGTAVAGKISATGNLDVGEQVPLHLDFDKGDNMLNRLTDMSCHIHALPDADDNPATVENLTFDLAFAGDKTDWTMTAAGSWKEDDTPQLTLSVTTNPDWLFLEATESAEMAQDMSGVSSSAGGVQNVNLSWGALPAGPQTSRMWIKEYALVDKMMEVSVNTSVRIDEEDLLSSGVMMDMLMKIDYNENTGGYGVVVTASNNVGLVAAKRVMGGFKVALATREAAEEFVQSPQVKKAFGRAIVEKVGVDEDNVDVRLSVLGARRLRPDSAGRRLTGQAQVNVVYTITVAGGVDAGAEGDAESASEEALTQQVAEVTQALDSTNADEITTAFRTELAEVNAEDAAAQGPTRPDFGEIAAVSGSFETPAVRQEEEDAPSTGGEGDDANMPSRVSASGASAPPALAGATAAAALAALLQ